MTEILELKDIALTIGGRTILENISFSMRERQLLTVIGPNGAGKTTLLKVIIGITAPTSGTLRRKEGLKIGYVPQKISIDPLFPMTVGQAVRRNGEIMERLGLTAISDAPLSGLSGGEMQRVLLARALSGAPDLLILDEAYQNLDVSGYARFYDLIKEVREKMAVLMISHDLNIVMRDTSEVICLNRHICCSGRPEEISSSEEFSRMFGGNSPGSFGIYRHNHDHSHRIDGEVTDAP